jgi:multiple sugar transport system permease protein
MQEANLYATVATEPAVERVWLADKSGQILLTLLVVLIGVITAFPLAWMVLTSLKTPAETMQTPPVWLPGSPSLDAYAQVAGVIQAGRSFANSAVIAGSTTFGILVTSLMAGYAFAKHAFKGRDVLFSIVVATMR